MTFTLNIYKSLGFNFFFFFFKSSSFSSLCVCMCMSNLLILFFDFYFRYLQELGVQLFFLFLQIIQFFLSVCVYMLVTHLCPTPCDPKDCSSPGSSVCGILQTIMLEWVAIPFSKGSSQPKDQTRSPALQADSLTSEPPKKPSFSSK